MTLHATPVLPRDASLEDVLSALEGHDRKPLVITYAGRRVQPGYHVTEVKAASFVTLDCGGQPDAWQETVLQVEDIPAEDGRSTMTVGKFRGILSQVSARVELRPEARLTFELSRPEDPMQVFDVAGVEIEGDAAVVSLAARPAICKPRHRATRQAVDSCCSSGASASCCA